MMNNNKSCPSSRWIQILMEEVPEKVHKGVAEFLVFLWLMHNQK